MDVSSTGLTDEQYNQLLGYFWPGGPDIDVNDEAAWLAACEEAEAVLQKLTTPEELHQLAWSYNWDDGTEVPNWIIRQPFCDRGTALLLYWRANPGWYCQYARRDQISEYQVDVYDLIKEIERLYLSGSYTQQNIHFDPTNDQGRDVTQDYIEYGDCIPSPMKESTPGKHLERAAF